MFSWSKMWSEDYWSKSLKRYYLIAAKTYRPLNLLSFLANTSSLFVGRSKLIKWNVNAGRLPGIRSTLLSARHKAITKNNNKKTIINYEKNYKDRVICVFYRFAIFLIFFSFLWTLICSSNFHLIREQIWFVFFSSVFFSRLTES